MFRTLSSSALLALLFTSSPAGSAPREMNGIAAIVNGRVITKSEVDEAAAHTREMIVLSIPPGKERERQLSKLNDDALDSLIERELILAEAAELAKSVGATTLIKEQMIEEDINKIIQNERFGGDRDKFLAELKKSGMTLKRFKDLRRKILTVEMMRSREGGGAQLITPAQLESAYAKHGDRFRGESFVRLRTLMIPKITADETVTAKDQRTLVTTIRNKILAGDDFAQMAKTYSEDSVADKGGDRGTIGQGSKELRKDLVAAALRLDSGQMSEVLEDSYAFWLLKAENKKLGAKKPLSDPDVRKACENLAQRERRMEAHDRWVAKLKRSASIRRFDGSGITSVAPPNPTSRKLTSPPSITSPDPRPADPPKEKKSVLDRLRIFKRDK